MPKDLTTFEIRAKLADLGLARFVLGGMCFGRETMLNEFLLPKIARDYLRS